MLGFLRGRELTLEDLLAPPNDGLKGALDVLAGLLEEGGVRDQSSSTSDSSVFGSRCCWSEDDVVARGVNDRRSSMGVGRAAPRACRSTVSCLRKE